MIAQKSGRPGPYKTGRSTDYHGAEAAPVRKYPLRSLDTTEDAAQQFERMARGYSPVCADGSSVTWVQDHALTPELRQWCAETAAMVRREAELAGRPRPKREQLVGAPAASRTRKQIRRDIETAVQRVLSRYPDASINQIVVMSGLQRYSVMKSEAWNLAQMGRKVKA